MKLFKKNSIFMLAVGCGSLFVACEGKKAYITKDFDARNSTQAKERNLVIPDNVTRPESHIAGDLDLSRADYDAMVAQEMLFGSNLQIGEMNDPSTGLTTSQVLSAGAHYVGRFVRLPSKLQLIADTSVANESDYPMQQVILTFDVVSETPESVSLRLANVGAGAALQWGLKNVSVRWVRSLAFDSSDKTLVVESSVRDEVAGGTFHFLESAFPRGRFGAMAKAIVKNGPDYPATPADEQYAQALARVGTFSAKSFVSISDGQWADKVVKKPLETANHYDISDGRTIDWWTTANAPDELLNDIAAGVEGWNRYFADFRSDGKVMKFRGRLPEGVKLGDFRYNVVRFDAVSAAGAAYESQNFDPQTGIQTNSMIYLPFAWYNLGKTDFVDGANATASDQPSAFVSAHTKCLRDLDFSSDAQAIMMETGRSPSDAGRALMRSTLLHEVGHALGMQHNFRGSNAGRIGARGEIGWTYSNSVMDYNAPALEDAALFTEINAHGQTDDSTKGARLAYDREFIDIVYNNAKQVLANANDFPVLPNCNDDDADNAVMGVDPTCIRYDFFAHPLEGIKYATARLSATDDSLDSSLGRFVSFNGVMRTVQQRGLKAIQTASVADVRANLSVALGEALSALKQFATTGYVSYRTAAVRYTPLLGEWKPVPADLDGASNDAVLGGWKTLPIFADDGKVSLQLYSQYQNDVRDGVLKIFADGLSTATGSADTSIAKAIQETVSVMDSLSAAAVARTDIDSVARNGLQRVGEKSVAAAKALSVSIATRMLTEISKLNWDGVVVGPKGEHSSGRANVSSAVTQQLFVDLVSVVQVTGDKVAPAMRASAASALVKIFQRSPLWDSAELRAQWETRLLGLLSSLRTEFADLDKVLKDSGYLSADQRERHEALSKMISGFQSVLKK